MARIRFAMVPVMALMLGGCLAKAAIGVVTAPVRVVAQAADWATTSQDEADRARGREIRGREARMGQLERDYEIYARQCEDGDDSACREAVGLRREMDELFPSLPLEPPPR